jgi:hypothetical protein
VDWAVASGAVNRIINFLNVSDDVSSQLVDVLHFLLVETGKVESDVSSDSVKLLIQTLFASTRQQEHHCKGMEIVTALSNTAQHGELIRVAVGSLMKNFASDVAADLLIGGSACNYSEQLLEAVKLLRSLKARNVSGEEEQLIGCVEMQRLWTALDAALSQPDDLRNVSELIPLIEVFFIAHSQSESHPRAASPQLVESSSQEVVKFCETHRKLLNLILSENPDLLLGSLNLVVGVCPWVLEFDNKRRFFRQKLKKLQQIGVNNQIKLSVRRSEVFMDSFYQLRHRSAEEMRGKLSVQFTGEEGVDAGGLVREWFGILAREIFNPNYALFRTAGGKASTFHPNPMSIVNPDHLSFFQFCGRIVGKAIFDDQRLDAYFTRSFYKHMLSSPVTWLDFEQEDPDYYKQLQWILSTDLESSPEAISVAENLTFTVDVDEFGHVRSVELVPGGSHIHVTQANKKEYVKLICEYKMTTSITPQVDSFLKGFHELIPADLVGSLFDDKELELLVSGLPAIDLSDLKANTDYVNYSPSSPQIQWLWKLLEEEFSQEQLAWFLQFVTGSAQVPLEGFKALVGMRGPQRFSVHKAYGSHRLPTAHTCFNQLDLPEYDDFQQLREKLMKAVTEAHEGFGFI